MYKKGFTLAEIVVTLGIIGIITAITGPSLINLMPDKTKVEVLKAHKLINDATIEMLDDPGLYYPNKTCKGLDCTAKPDRILDGETATSMSSYSGAMKYPKLLCYKMLSDGCTASTTQVTFTTPDGNDWTVTNANKITVDVNGADGPNKTFTSSYAKKDIDRFVFEVSPRGYVTGYDSLTARYLQNRDKLNDKALDYKCAANPSTKGCS